MVEYSSIVSPCLNVDKNNGQAVDYVYRFAFSGKKSSIMITESQIKLKKRQHVKEASLTGLYRQNIMKDALEFQGREMASDEENIPAEKKKEAKITRFYEKDVHLQRQEGFEPQKEKGTC